MIKLDIRNSQVKCNIVEAGRRGAMVLGDAILNGGL